MTTAPPLIEPFFLNGGADEVFALYRGPESPERAVLILPPFAEEMNKSRRMLTLLAEGLAAAGTGTLLVDLHGTGDSHGDFRDARWQTWVQDLLNGVEWLRRRGVASVSLLGFRMGALLAPALIAETAVQRLALWQPVVSGETLLTQFLRLRLASGMLDSQRERESTKDLRRRLTEGEGLEVAGYTLSPELCAALDAQRLADAEPATLPPVDWFEFVGDPSRGLSPGSRRLAERWSEAGASVATHPLKGQAFWSTTEITVEPELVSATVAALGEAR